MFRDAWLVAGKDLRIELRSRVALNQVAPFALLVLILFAFALDPDSGVLDKATPGLFWVAVLFCGLLAIQRSFAVEAADGNRDALRLSGLAPGGHLPRQGAGRLPSSCWPSRCVLGVGRRCCSTAATSPAGGCCSRPAWPRPPGSAAAGTLYGVLAAGLRVRETLLPLLLLPVLAPVLIGVDEGVRGGPRRHARPGLALGRACWRLFAVAYTVIGALGFGSLLEDS